jgi:cell division protein FtsB
MRWLLIVLLVLLGVMQYRLWLGEGSLAERHRLQQQVEEQVLINEELRARNAVLEREVLELQTGNQGLEQRAREELGLVKEGETFYQLVEEEQPGREQDRSP